MNKNNYFVLFLGFTLLLAACKSEVKQEGESSSIESKSKTVLETRFDYLLSYPVDSMGFPRSMSLDTIDIHKVPSKDWTSGFYPGNLWQIYALTGDDRFKEKAIAWTALMENQKLNGGTHDMGFKINCSFGEGLKDSPSEAYNEIMLTSAQTLITRYNENVGSLKSWDKTKENWEYPVIVDNMMNLELLFEATRISGDSTFYNIAVSHANTTLKNQFRPDNSIYHVVEYDSLTGSVKSKGTHQGFAKESSWARGQAWGIYGFTMAYRYTKNESYLAQAEATAQFYMNHVNLPKDGVPYWDFNDPAIPNAPRDASAAAIVSSALFELYSFTKNEMYLNFATRVLDSLNSEKYILDPAIQGPFILGHSTGNWPKNDEIDEPIVYADYYFLQALLRKKAN